MAASALAFGMGAAVLPSAVSAETTLTAVMEAPLRSLDPVITTSYIVRNYGYMVYDTLLAMDEKGAIQPQMLEGWKVSDDGKSYTFTLRQGLKWHDGKPVRAADAVQSIKRWMQLDKMGQIMAGFLTGMEVMDDLRFSMKFDVATDIALRALAKPSSLPAFIMPEAVAATPISQPITSVVGSGPFTFVQNEYKPGVQAVFAKNTGYVPRNEPPSGLAGGKVVKVDKVKWVAMPDAMTGVNALRNGEIDLIEQASFDLLPLLKGDSKVNLMVSTERGGQTELRFNFLHPPFNNKLVRQAALAAFNQESILQAQIGNPDYYNTCGAVFGCASAFPSQAGSEPYLKGDAKAAQALLKKAGYKGEPVVLLHPTDVPVGVIVPVIAQQLRNAGFVVKVEAMDWQTVQTRRTSKRPIAEGGWSIIITYSGLSDIGNPLSFMGVAANGDKAWFGWPDIPAIEEARLAFAKASGDAELTRIATDIQRMIMDDGVIVPLGEFRVVTAMRSSVSGFMKSAVPVFWNVEKK
ncbi:ABC transporter substrate-binding protein [Parapusillimonas sp. SGNA-6]|nr:ABC transporter substrate-binding protein [Parapusillimonas sp. SGNA-6]